jgi:hypothetical protein
MIDGHLPGVQVDCSQQAIVCLSIEILRDVLKAPIGDSMSSGISMYLKRYVFDRRASLVRSNFIWAEGANPVLPPQLRPLAHGHKPAIRAHYCRHLVLTHLLLPK